MPRIYNVYAAQRSGTRLVDITYDAVYSGTGMLLINVDISTDAGVSYTLPANHLSGDIGSVAPGRNHRIVWDAEADWPGQASGAMRVRVTATAPGSDIPAPTGMRTIPAGSFLMGDPHGNGAASERPRHSVMIGRFHIDQHHVTKSLWDSVKTWALISPLPYVTGAGYGKASDQPIQSMDWYTAVKWCNARSEMEGRKPCYYLTPALTDVYRSGSEENLSNDCVDWYANGYRLPTEAEWEKAARGGLVGHHYPWNSPELNYELYFHWATPECGWYYADTPYHDSQHTKNVPTPWTSPVDYFTPNGYDLYDMAGNAFQWCWDAYQPDWYSQPSATAQNPHGPDFAVTGYRIIRGGSWIELSGGSFRCSARGYTLPDNTNYALGFRCVTAGALPGDHDDWYSNIFALLTEDTSTGWISGRIVTTNSVVTNAHIEVDTNGRWDLSETNGTFIISGVPTGVGYMLNVTAEGYESERVLDVAVFGDETNDVGDIEMTPTEPHCLIEPLVPDLNPGISSAPFNGFAHRYYMVLNRQTKEPAPVQDVILRIKDGEEIPQDGLSEDWMRNWAGTTPGLSDLDGILRVKIPGNLLTWTPQKMELVMEDKVLMEFEAQRVAETYSHIWKHKNGLGLGGDIFVELGVNLGSEAEVEHAYTVGQSTTVKETITRKLSGDLNGGLEAGGGIRVGVVGATASSEVNLAIQAELAAKYAFANPNSPGVYDNAMRLLLTTGDPMSFSGHLILQSLYDEMMTSLVPDYTNQLDSAGSKVQLTGTAEAGANAFLGGSSLSIGAGANLSAFMSGNVGAGYDFGSRKTTHSVGVEFGYKAKAQLGGHFGNIFKEDQVKLGRTWGYAPQEAQKWAYTGFATRDAFSTQFAYESKTSLQISGLQFSLDDIGISLADEGLSFTGLMEVSDKHTYPPLRSSSAPTGSDIKKLQLGSNDIRITPRIVFNIAKDLYDLLEAEDLFPSYELTVYRAIPTDLTIPFDLDFGAGLELELAGGMERGLQAVVERGRIVRGKVMPFQTSPAPAANRIPSEEMSQLIVNWTDRAITAVWDFLKEYATSILFGENTVIDLSDQTGNSPNAKLTIHDGALTPGSTVTTLSGPSRAPAGTATPAMAPKAIAGTSEQLPPSGASNYVYGIGGVVHFSSDATFSGTAELVIAYTDDDVEGLDESALRIYRERESNGGWESISGIVNTGSNTVTATITQLGTYAIAPPLPTGALTLQADADVLQADGTSFVTVTVSNLLLNTGAAATGEWVYTVYTVGAEILDEDIDVGHAATQLTSSNAVLSLRLGRAMGSGTASLVIVSQAGDAVGSMQLNLLDELPPGPPSGLVVTSQQSRVYVSWSTNHTADVVHHRVYYNKDTAGPPYNGTARIEGDASPVAVPGHSVVLRGLDNNATYHVAVSAVDATGLESSLTVAGPAITADAPPHPPEGVAAMFGTDGTNRLMWALSSDDEYNDRDVIRYDIYLTVLPGGSPVKIADVPAGRSTYREPAPSAPASHYHSYSVVAVDGSGRSSPQIPASRVLPFGLGLDADGDGIADLWEEANELNPEDPDDSSGNPDQDPLSNLEEFVAGTDPNDDQSYFHISNMELLQNGTIAIEWLPVVNDRVYRILQTDSMTNWSAGQTTRITDPGRWESNMPSSNQFYRISVNLE